MSCIVRGCFTRKSKKVCFDVPQNKTLMKKWLEASGRNYTYYAKTPSVCRDHFEDSAFVTEPGEGKLCLKEGAVPVLKLPPPMDDSGFKPTPQIAKNNWCLEEDFNVEYFEKYISTVLDYSTIQFDNDPRVSNIEQIYDRLTRKSTRVIPWHEAIYEIYNCDSDHSNDSLLMSPDSNDSNKQPMNDDTALNCDESSNALKEENKLNGETVASNDETVNKGNSLKNAE